MRRELANLKRPSDERERERGGHSHPEAVSAAIRSEIRRGNSTRRIKSSSAGGRSGYSLTNGVVCSNVTVEAAIFVKRQSLLLPSRGSSSRASPPADAACSPSGGRKALRPTAQSSVSLLISYIGGKGSTCTHVTGGTDTRACMSMYVYVRERHGATSGGPV